MGNIYVEGGNLIEPPLEILSFPSCRFGYEIHQNLSSEDSKTYDNRISACRGKCVATGGMWLANCAAV